MERLKELITQLKEQFDRQAEPAQLLEITRQVEAEIRLLASQPPAPARVVPTKITVMMPSSAKIVAGSSQPQPTKEPEAPVVIPVTPAVPSPSASAAPPSSPYAPTPAPAPVTNGTAVATQTATLKTVEKERGQWPFDPLAEKPTDRFTLSQRTKEVNDVIGSKGTSLNDKLKTDVSDVRSTLHDAPVRDLKKAIGLNDRYLFINQLFRGDEVMYERSLKTINGFRILPEAEYWMERELKVKLGWDENRETTKHFYQLVKRRFS